MSTRFYTWLTLFVLELSGMLAFAGNPDIKSTRHSAISICDSLRILELLEKGDKFIDGPSDSLLYYYSKALRLLNINLKTCDNDELPFYLNQGFKVNIGLGIEFFYKNAYDSALSHYTQALNIAQGLNDPDMLSECYSELGILYKHQGKYGDASSFYEKALEQASLSTDTSWIAACQMNLGNAYKEQGYYVIAQKQYLQALATLERIGHDRWIAACYQNIGDIHGRQKDYHIAIGYLNKTLNIAIRTEDKVREITALLQMAYIYNQVGTFNKALSYLEQTLPLYDKSGYHHERDEFFVQMGDSHFGLMDYELAVDYYKKALDISESKQDLPCISQTKGKIGNAYVQLRNYSLALSYFQQSQENATELGTIDLLIESNKNLSQIHEMLGHHEKSLLHYKMYSSLKDSLYNQDKYKAVKDLELKYESDKKEQQLTILTKKHELQALTLSRRNKLFFATTAGILLLVLVAYLLYNQRRLKTKHRAIDLEQRLLRSQMNPHFIFNSLIAIQSYIYNKEPLIAGDYLAKFADLVRLTLENSRSEFVILEKEIKTLNTYLELQALRFEDEFNYEVETEQGIDSESILIPPMFAQPFVENAIEHGIRHKNEKGIIKIRYQSLNECCMRISVEDDGIGRDEARRIKNPKEHQSLALCITKERLRTFSKKYKQLFEMQVIDLFDKQNNAIGTRVILTLPIILK